MSLETVQQLLEEANRGVTRSMELANENNYPGASGYARGTLDGIAITLDCALTHLVYEEDYAPLQ
jgi:hypothetical protein